MTTRSVRSTIREAMRLKSAPCAVPTITGREAGKIVKEAEKGVVTVGEARAIGDMFDRSLKLGTDNAMTEMCPEVGADTPVLTNAAEQRFQAFFVKHNLPMGNNAGTIKQQAQNAILLNGLGEQVKFKKKPDFSNRFPVVLHDHRPVDGDKQIAHVDMKTREFWVESTGFSRMTAGEFHHYYGPFTLTDEQPRLTLAFPENPGDDLPPAMTDAIPENPGDDVVILPAVQPA